MEKLLHTIMCPQMRVWFARNSAVATGTILFSIGNVDAISLFGSRVLGACLCALHVD